MVIDRRFLVLPALVALAARNADAFTPANFGASRTASNSVRFSMVSTENDVSIAYDSAARLAYKDWCAKFDKEANDERYETFKSNYEAISVANVSAAKKARDDGVDRPKDLELNEYGDMSEEEYLNMQSGAGESTPAEDTPAAPEKGAMESVMEASMAQNDASNALAEAADVSIAYDSAARLAYKDWCAKFDKEANDERYGIFKSNYEAITVANVSAAKKARDDGVDRPKDLELNEYGDMSEEEYLNMQSGADESTPAEDTPAAPEKGAMESVMEASMAQNDASNALAESADAMAEEEEQLAQALGLESIEELEEAIDTIQGIDAEGVEVDTSDVREVRVRAAYMDWCKEYGKSPDETRFPTFSSNFLAMEEYANENGREMVLNKYADCTEEEYRQLTNTAAPAPELVVEKPIEKESAAPKDDLPKKEEPKAESPKKEEPKKKEPEAEAKVEEKPKPAPKAPPKPAPKPEPVLSLEEEAIMMAKAAREAEAAQIAKRRELDEQAAQMEREKAAAASVKQQQQQTVIPTPPKTTPTESKEGGNIFGSLFQSTPKKVAQPAAKKEIAIEPPKKDKSALNAAGARVAEQRKAEQTAIKASKAPLKKDEGPGILGSIFGSSDKAPTKTVIPVKPSPPTPVKAEKKAESSNPFSFLQPAAEKPKAKETSEPPKVLTKPEKADVEMAPNAMTEALSSFFGTTTKAPAPVAPPKPEPIVEPPKPKPQPFNLFGSKPAAKNLEVKPAATKPAPARKPSPTLSLFGGASPKPAPKTPSVPVSAPAPKGSGTFSLFSSPPAVKKVEPAPTPASKKPAPAFGGFFGGSSPKPAPKVPIEQPKPAEKAPIKGSGTFSLFGDASTPPKPNPVAQKPLAAKKAPVKKASSGAVAGIGGFGSFGANKKTVKQPARAAGTISVTNKARGPGTISISSQKKTTPPPVKKVDKAKGSGTFSLFGGSSPTPVPAPEPVKTPAKGNGTFSIFGGGAPTKKAAPAPEPAKTPAKGSGTFSIFGGGAPTKKAAPAPVEQKAKPVAKPAGGFFGGAKKGASKVVANDGIPVVSNFKQNSDLSITGKVRNSKSFRNGTEITTSPVRRGAKSGDVVTTSSGSKYRLE